ncbi:MAG TPA: DUF1631 family protein [Usitatibacter sp.]|nr:DUF1631 family protein [Usitatibacter sp.]
MSQATDAGILGEIRDSLARPYGEALAARVPQVVDVLEQQLALSDDRGQWKSLRGAVDLLKALRPTLAARITREVAAKFDARVQPGGSAFGKTARFSLDSLSLVADDQVQQEIALGNATRRLKEQLGDELFALTHRVAAVMDREELSDDSNPVFPRIFARGLLDALEEPGADGASRLAAFSGFAPVILEEVASAYHDTNRWLRERGVLPDFKRSYGAPVQPGRRGGPSPASAAPAGTGTPAASGAVAATSLERLFAMASGGGAGFQAAPGPAAPGPPGTVTLNVRPELVEALRNLEPNLASLLAASQRPSAGAPAAYPQGSAAVHQAKEEMRGSLDANDIVIADLVAALFDRLFLDARLADATRAQIGRLQIPVFKAVLRDRTFFSDALHPIRLLIDTMAELGASDEAVTIDGAPPSRWIARVVGEILERHAEDPMAFARAAPRLAQVLERHRDAAMAQDAQIRELRERDEKLSAVREASLAIAHRLSSATYPQEADAYLYGRFRDVLLHDFVRGGESSPNWNADIEILDDILWVLTPRVTAADRERLASLLPSLLFRLRMAYQRAGISPESTTQYLEELRTLLDEVMRSPVAAAHGALRKVPAPMPADDYTATLHVNSGSLAAEGLARGTWFEFTEEDGSKRRCRLNWMSPVQGTCVFKDLALNRSFAISLDELRERRERGSAVPVDGPGVARSSVEGAIADVARALGGQA